MSIIVAIGSGACLVIGAVLLSWDVSGSLLGAALSQVQAEQPDSGESFSSSSTEQDADPIIALSIRYGLATQEVRKGMMVEVRKALESYGKNWHGNSARQLIYEGSYIELTATVGHDMAEGGNGWLVEDVAEMARLRAEYLSNDSALAGDVEDMREKLLAGKYLQCKEQCEKIMLGCFGRLPGVELALAMCDDALGEWEISQRRLLEVIELCHGIDEEKAAAAAYLAARGMFSRADFENAWRMFSALQEDYPNSAYASEARQFAQHLDSMLHRPAKAD